MCKSCNACGLYINSYANTIRITEQHDNNTTNTRTTVRLRVYICLLNKQVDDKQCDDIWIAEVRNCEEQVSEELDLMLLFFTPMPDDARILFCCLSCVLHTLVSDLVDILVGTHLRIMWIQQDLLKNNLRASPNLNHFINQSLSD